MPDNVTATHIKGGFIEVIQDPVTITSCNIKIYLYTDPGSTVRSGGGSVDFGDGTLPFELGNTVPDSKMNYSKNVLLSIFSITHEYPGPGNYTINYSEFNRNGGIANINNSVNTPFFIESRITIDPFYGANSTPHIVNAFLASSPLATPYLFSIVARDPEGDSMTFTSVIPMKGKDQEADSFFIPSTSTGNIILSEMFITNTGDILWQQPSQEGQYVYAVRIDEWMKTATGWINLGYMVFDFMFNTFISNNPPAVLTGLRDTAFVSGSQPLIPFQLSDGNGDLLRVQVNSDLNPDYLVRTDLDDTISYPVPKTGTISIKDSVSLIRNKPYKIVAVITENKIDEHRPFFIWFTDNPSNPQPPQGLKMDYANRYGIKISWNKDSNNVAGYTVERADTYNPGFIRIGALGNNVSSFIDESVLEGRDYFYRLKAIGTSRSATSSVLKINKDEIIDVLDRSTEQNEILLYPNPASAIINIKFSGNYSWVIHLKLYDNMGRVKKIIEPDDLSLPVTLDVSDLERGVYIIIFQGKGINQAKRFVKY